MNETALAAMSVSDLGGMLRGRAISATELLDSTLGRIAAVNGTPSFDGDPESVNAWIRIYEEDARRAAAAADARLSAREQHTEGPPSPLCGIPIGLKDLFAVAGKPLTASSRVLDDVPEEDSEVWRRLRAAGMVLVGHLHTHEFAAGGTTPQVGNPWNPLLSAGGSSGGSAAALAAGMVPAAAGTDTAGSVRVPSALCGTSAIKPSYGLVSMEGVVPVSASLDHAGPMARTVADCALLLAAMASRPPGDDPGARSLAAPADRPLEGVRLAVSPRADEVGLDPDVADGLDAALSACRRLGAELVGHRPVPRQPAFDPVRDLLALSSHEALAYHERFRSRRHLYRTSTRQMLEMAETARLDPEAVLRLSLQRDRLKEAWGRWFQAERVTALVEPTLPVPAIPRDGGYDRFGGETDGAILAFTPLWDWVGFPVVTLPAGVGTRSRMPVSISLVGAHGDDSRLLEAGAALQADLGTPGPAAMCG